MECTNEYSCPMEKTLNLIGGKYKALILWHLRNSPIRFNELRRLIKKASPKVLTQQLRELEKDKLIFRKVYPVVPTKVEYGLTDNGKSLIPILNEMCHWSKNIYKSN